jgi:hypothetical protein
MRRPCACPVSTLSMMLLLQSSKYAARESRQCICVTAVKGSPGTGYSCPGLDAGCCCLTNSQPAVHPPPSSPSYLADLTLGKTDLALVLYVAASGTYNLPAHHPFDPPTHPPTHSPTHPPTRPPAHQPTHPPPTNQPTNQPTNPNMLLVAHLVQGMAALASMLPVAA